MPQIYECMFRCIFTNTRDSHWKIKDTESLLKQNVTENENHEKVWEDDMYHLLFFQYFLHIVQAHLPSCRSGNTDKTSRIMIHIHAWFIKHFMHIMQKLWQCKNYGWPLSTPKRSKNLTCICMHLKVCPSFKKYFSCQC